jgi:hypothetical protein
MYQNSVIKINKTMFPNVKYILSFILRFFLLLMILGLQCHKVICFFKQ